MDQLECLLAAHVPGLARIQDSLGYGFNLLVCTSANHGSGPIRFCSNIGDILAAKDLSHISKIGRCCSILVVFGNIIKR